MTSVTPNQQPVDDSPSSGTSVTTIIACNSVSVFVCIVTLSIYASLSMKAKYKRIMRRRSLVLAACMATSDLILHSSNLAGYGTLPPGFACAFVGGWLFAAPTMLSIFYSCTIALNSQLAFVFKRRPPSRALSLFILGPIIVSFIIAFCALGTGVYGFDQTWGYCWYATEGIPASTVLIRMLFTYSLPTLLCMLYLIIATVTISYAVFGNGVIPTGSGSAAIIPPITDTPFSSNTFPRSSSTSTSPPHKPSFIKSSLASLKEEVKRDRKRLKFSTTELASGAAANTAAIAHHPKRSDSTGRQPSVHVRVEGPHRRLSLKTAVMRQLTVRLIGYIITPLLCLLPGIILDLTTKVIPDLEVSIALNAIFDGLNGLVGLFNSILMLSDPALLAVWDDLRALVSKRTADGSSEEASGVGIGRRRGMSSVDDDVLASGFGLGARTRMGDVEEGVMMEEGTGGGVKTIGEGSGDPIRPTSPIHSDGVDDIHEGASGRYPPRSDLRDRRDKPTSKDADKDERNRDARVEEGRLAERGVDQGLEIHVRVDVTQEATKRMSRIDQMEDWLDGL